LIIGLAIYSYAEVWGADWKLFTTTKNGDTYYYDPESITHPSKDIVRVWTKDIPSGEKIVPGRDEVYYRYAKILFEFHCVEREYRILFRVFYSQDDRVLSSVNPEDEQWRIAMRGAAKRGDVQAFDKLMLEYLKNKERMSKSRFIVPESSVEKLYKIVCSNSK
jgi:hypothetical protein